MRNRVLLIVISMLGMLGLGLGPWITPVHASTVSDEQTFVQKINQLRASKGLAPLQVNSELTAIARRWAGEMARVGDISHNPSFSSQVTQNWTLLGENVGMGPEVGSLHQAFVDSPSHYRNLVESRFTHIGVGVVRDENGTIFTAHQFMALAGAAAVSTPAPTSPPQASEAATQPVPNADLAAAPAATAPHAPTTPDSALEAAPATATLYPLVLRDLRTLEQAA